MKKKVYAGLALVAALGVGSLTWNYLPTEAKEASVGLFQPAKEDNGKSAEAESKAATEGQKKAQVVSDSQAEDQASQKTGAKKSARLVEDNSPQEETEKAQAKSGSASPAADQAQDSQAGQAEFTTKTPASKTPVTVTDANQARQAIIDVVGLDAHALDAYTDEQILESVAAAEELGSDPGYSYRYLQEHFGK
ncbi:MULTISPECIES: hypothetical protein [Aerococcus]|uniref:Uncharacterized protein n=1 Tax=Aerococcus sanguinicola TaxID=119206 RepID=A0A5N1GNB4_9LACT|nr:MULTISPECIES: hypothetical protein [Aerococcus]KAA9302457.1 hypothetical protein F6I03_04345 [Aerococcus sanguinicola]MDK6369832.1 hypothetical protein [Aerococcus sp. UMB9870]MDK6680472.1 hypothetical protein [Aerococcus sp. UMB8608]MDK6687640.1 hypothetical protein [Aerococcus sp. UMB8623]MDK6940250.1 hypothetical protein [Aerococcus sp. UMB8487]